jgi:hypothetical protein
MMLPVVPLSAMKMPSPLLPEMRLRSPASPTPSPFVPTRLFDAALPSQTPMTFRSAAVPAAFVPM